MAKIVKLYQLPKLIKGFKKNNFKIVLATGVFDLLHQEHKNFLAKAKKSGHILLVGLETDKRVLFLKGKGRPIWPINKRLNRVAMIKAVDYVFSLPEKFYQTADHEHLIKMTKPDILAVSSHTLHQNIKKILVNKYGGKLRLVLKKNPLVSTSQLIKLNKINP